MEKLRTIQVKFLTQEALDTFSKKIFLNNEKELLPNLKEVQLNKGSFEFTYRKNVRQKAAELKEWQKHWNDLTDFAVADLDPHAFITFKFCDEWDFERLKELFEQNITKLTKSIYYPIKETANVNRKRYLGQRGNPQYPIYIISKGRSKSCVTADHLIKMGVEFNIVIEKSEWEDYAAVYGENRLVELDLNFRTEYDTYIRDFDDKKSKGSGPARNFVWHHAKNVVKSDWHWIIDDNIFGFHYYNNSERIKAVDGTLFASAEDFVNRYDNIAISGLNYYMFAVPGSKNKPYVANTKIYSCLLINNHADIRWAGRYNEDVDICIRALKEGYSTIQFDAFLAKKAATQTFGGGNTDAFYAEEGTLPKSNMLMFNHPDITEVTWRFQRWHHITNYNIFDYYKDRNIEETIRDMMKQPLLNTTHKDIIDVILSTDFSKLEKWHHFLEDIDSELREELFKVLKFYRYKKNSEEIVQILTLPKILNCDLDNYLWDAELADSEDNRIMLDLFKLGDKDGFLFNAVNWDETLHYISADKRKLIKDEMERNKYLMRPYEKFNHKIDEYLISEEDHEHHHDSKAYMLNNYKKTGENLEVPSTLYDKKIRKEEIIKQKKTFKNKLTARGSEIEKVEETNTLLVLGDEEFNNDDLLIEKVSELIELNNHDEMINSVNYPVDLLAANYALDNKLKNKEFVPDDTLYGKGAYKEIYKNMVQYTDKGVLFVQGELTPDLEYLKTEMEKANKELIIIKDTVAKTEVLDEW